MGEVDVTPRGIPCLSGILLRRPQPAGDVCGNVEQGGTEPATTKTEKCMKYSVRKHVDCRSPESSPTPSGSYRGSNTVVPLPIGAATFCRKNYSEEFRHIPENDLIRNDRCGSFGRILWCFIDQ